MATHSSILAWQFPGTEKPGGLQSIGSQTDTLKGLSNSTDVYKNHKILLRRARVIVFVMRNIPNR